jgi:hypothetical protein
MQNAKPFCLLLVEIGIVRTAVRDPVESASSGAAQGSLGFVPHFWT